MGGGGGAEFGTTHHTRGEEKVQTPETQTVKEKEDEQLQFGYRSAGI